MITVVKMVHGARGHSGRIALAAWSRRYPICGRAADGVPAFQVDGAEFTPAEYSAKFGEPGAYFSITEVPA